MLKDILIDAIKSEAPAKWPTFDSKLLERNNYLTSSECKGCLRKAYFDKNPKQYPSEGFNGNGFTHRGHSVEDWVVRKMLPLSELGYKFFFVGENQRSFYLDECGLSGTPDGVMQLPDGEKVLLEFKSYDPRSNVSNFPKEPHEYQLQQNMYLVNECLGWSIKRGLIVYINASDYYTIYEFERDYDEMIVQECIDRAAELWNAVEPGDLAPEGIATGACDYCSHGSACSEGLTTTKAMAKLAEAGKPKGNFSVLDLPELAKEDKLALAEYVADVSTLSTMKKALDEDKQRVFSILEGQGGRAYVDGTLYEYVTVPGQSRFNLAMATEAGVPVKDYYKQGRPTGKLTTKTIRED